MTDLVVLSLEAWDGVWRRNQYLVAGLLRRDPGLRVLFVEPAADPLYEVSLRRRPRFGRGLRAVSGVPGVGDGRLWAYQPTKALPRKIDPWVDARAASGVRRAARRVGFRAPLLWVNDPNAAGVVDATRWPALYDITDDWLLADRSPAEHARLERDEATLMASCAEVVVCSPALAEAKGAIRPVTLVPNAVDLEAYRQPAPRPADLPPGPVAAYLGTVHRDRMDVDLCAATARAIQGVGRLVLVGPAPLAPADRDLLAEAGVVLLGAKDRSEVPAYLQHADVLVVPHVVTPFTDSLDPIKAYEYRAVGRPVVTTPVAGFRDHQDARTLVAPAEEFAEAVRRVLAAPSSDGVGAGDDPPTWEDRVTQMGEVLARVEAVRPVRRIGLNGKWTGQSLTGTQRYATEITRRIVAADPAAYVLHVPADGVVPHWAGGARVRRSRLRGNAFEQVALPWAARREVLLSLGGPAPLLARRQVVTMHDATPFRFPETYSRLFGAWYRFLYRVLARRAERVLTVSRFSAGELAEVLGVPEGIFTVIPDGSDHLDGLEPHRPDVPIDDGEPFALCIGTFARHKNLASSLSELDRAGIRTVLVGPRGARRVFDAATGRTTGGVGEEWANAVVAGRLSDAEIRWLYSHATALVFPSRYEGFGLPVVEAQRAGCPVIVSDLPFAREVAGDGAVYVDADRPGAVVEAFRAIASDPDLRTRLVADGRRNTKRYLWDASARGVLAVLREIDGVPRRRDPAAGDAGGDGATT